METSPPSKEKRLSIRASGREKSLLAQAARTLRIDRTEFRFASEQWEAFCERLEAPPQTIPALRRLFDAPEPY